MRHLKAHRKLGRTSAHRLALLKNLAISLVKYEAIETTLPKAKELVRYIEKLITKAKIGDLNNRRIVIAALDTEAAAFRLFDLIAPQLTARSSGHVRVERTELRVGDGTQMATISFVDEINEDFKAKPVEAVKASKKTKKVVEKSSVVKAKEKK